MKKNLRLLALTAIPFIMQGCATVSRNNTFRTCSTVQQVRMSDLCLVGESEVSVSYRTVLGFRHTDKINGIDYDPSNYNLTQLDKNAFLGATYVGALRKAYGKVLDDYPEARYFQVVETNKKSQRLFLGTDSELKALVRAYTFCPMAEEENDYTLDDILEMLENGSDVTGKTFTAAKMVNFDIDQSVIKAESFEYLNRLADMLKRTGAKVEVKGHTDNTGTENHNMELSRNRANSVVEYLVSRGVKRENLSTSHYGSSRPIDTNDTAEGRLRNRRIEFEILK